MSDAWNPEDGPPPNDEERAAARDLAGAIAHGREHLTSDPAIVALVATAQRVRATAHPEPGNSREVAQRAVCSVVARDRPLARLLRWPVAASVAAAGFVVLAVGLGLRRGDRLHDGPADSTLPTAFREAVQPGAGAMPATLLFERRLRLYREGYLRRGAP